MNSDLNPLNFPFRSFIFLALVITFSSDSLFAGNALKNAGKKLGIVQSIRFTSTYRKHVDFLAFLGILQNKRAYCMELALISNEAENASTENGCDEIESLEKHVEEFLGEDFLSTLTAEEELQLREDIADKQQYYYTVAQLIHHPNRKTAQKALLVVEREYRRSLIMNNLEIETKTKFDLWRVLMFALGGRPLALGATAFYAAKLMEVSKQKANLSKAKMPRKKYPKEP